MDSGVKACADVLPVEDRFPALETRKPKLKIVVINQIRKNLTTTIELILMINAT